MGPGYLGKVLASARVGSRPGKVGKGEARGEQLRRGE